MAFHSWKFGVFMLIVTGLFWLLANRRDARSYLLLVASYIFYGAWTPWFLLLIVFSTILDFFCGRAMGASEEQSVRRRYLLLSLGGNLGLLCFFKYSHWLSSLVDPLLASAGVPFELMSWSWAALAEDGGWRAKVVPVGISFYTFQTLSYTIDIYRGKLRHTDSFRDFALFVAFFPQLVAGPIVRAVDFLPQLELKPRFDRERLHDGLYRIAIGLAKKALIADTLGAYLVDPCYAEPGNYTAFFHVLALYGFTLQIYYDFSGYSDIAIGAARILGFDLPENFIGPYQSLSIREFWRRWHITLSFWVRDYIYFPLGGSKGAEWFVVRNLMITMVVIGLWHGASILWIYYGLMQGGVMALERMFERRRGGELFATTTPKKLLSWFLTFHFIVFSCLFIRAETWPELTAMLEVFGDEGVVLPRVWWALIGGAVIHFLPMPWMEQVKQRVVALPTIALGLLLGILSGILMIVMVGETPFIYFQF